MQHYTFYDFIVNKARGKSGPLFNFDVHDDVRLTHDATVEKDEVKFLSFIYKKNILSLSKVIIFRIRTVTCGQSS